MMEILEDLRHKGLELLRSDPQAQQVIVLQASSGNIYHCISREILSGDTSAQEELVCQMWQKKDTLVKSLVCLWYSNELDVPSVKFRQALLALNSGNADTRVMLQTLGGFMEKPLSALF